MIAEFALVVVEVVLVQAQRNHRRRNHRLRGRSIHISLVPPSPSLRIFDCVSQMEYGGRVSYRRTNCDTTVVQIISILFSLGPMCREERTRQCWPSDRTSLGPVAAGQQEEVAELHSVVGVLRW